MDVTPTGCPGCTCDAVVPAAAYRVVLWEQPDVESVHPESIGWGEVAFDVTGSGDVREVIAWAEEQMAAGAGCYSQKDRRVRDREYVVYAYAADRTLVQVAGWDPTRPRSPNLPRLVSPPGRPAR